jgi:hypothetical protein
MTCLSTLWLPILLSAVAVFIVSSIMHTVLQYHRRYCLRLPSEEKFLTLLRPDNLKPGMYVFPYCEPKQMKLPENAEKYAKGPVGFLTVFGNGTPNIGKFLVQWFVFCVLVSLFVAYLTAHTVATGASFHKVFHFAAITGFLAYGFGHLSDGIWKGQQWGATLVEVLDGLVYGLVSAAIFGWLWPH